MVVICPILLFTTLNVVIKIEKLNFMLLHLNFKMDTKFSSWKTFKYFYNNVYVDLLF